MNNYKLIIFLLYLALSIYISRSSLEFDIYKVKFRLLPSWGKIASVILTLTSILVLLIFGELIENSKHFFISVINLALFIFFFSKRKSEDEYSEHVRLKAFAYSFVGFIFVFGAFSALQIGEAETGLTGAIFLYQVVMGATFLTAILYFYITLYQLRKENN